MMEQNKFSREELADYIVRMQPMAVQGRLLEDSAFRKDFGIHVNRAVAYPNGPTIPKQSIYETAQAVLGDMQPRSFGAMHGEKIDVTFVNGQIFLSFKQKDGTIIEVNPHYLMFMSSDTSTRLSALGRSLSECGPTGPDPEYWRPLLSANSLDAEKTDEFSRQLMNTVTNCFGRIQHDIEVGSIDKSHLAPKAFEYWTRLCGAPAHDASQEEWIRTVLNPHRQQLIKRDLKRGLEICLAMNLSDDLMVRDLVKHASNDELWAVVQSLAPLDNPFSLVGIVDISVARSYNDDRFAALAEQTIKRLCAEKLERLDGTDVYEFFPSIVDFELSELLITPRMANQPAYWRRICAWTQSGLIMKSFGSVTFDPVDIASDFVNMHSPRTVIAELLDLRETPLWSPMNTNKILMRAEVIARLKILQAREERAENVMPGSDVLDEAAIELGKSGPFLMQMPGPLELHKPLHHQLPDMEVTQQDDLKTFFKELTSDLDDQRWVTFTYLSRVIHFDDDTLSHITNLIPEVSFGNTAEQRRNTLHHLGQISLIAVTQKYTPLAETILARCLGETGDFTNTFEASAYMRMGLIAAAALDDASERNMRLAGYLLNLAHRVPSGEASRLLSQHIEDLKILTPATDWHYFARSEAVAMLGS